MPTARDPIQEFMTYNRPFARRNPELLRFKVARMADGPFAFFRGTFHLFARDVLDRNLQPLPLLKGDGVEMDLVGDLHSENYGTYKAADGMVHYDVRYCYGRRPRIGWTECPAWLPPSCRKYYR